MSNNAKVGGILSIVSGALGVLWFLGAAFFALVLLFVPVEVYYDFGPPYYSSPPSEEVAAFLFVFFMGLALVPGVLGVLAIVGGVFALMKKHWGWALAGAIASLFVFLPTGVAAVVFVSMGKREFSPLPPYVTRQTPPAPPTAPPTS